MMIDVSIVKESIQDLENKSKALYQCACLINNYDNICMGSDLEWMYKDIEKAYQNAIQSIVDIHTVASQIFSDKETEEIERSCQRAANIPITAAKYYPDIATLQCTLMAPPLLKKKTAKAFLKLICAELEKEIIHALPENLVRFERAYVIYINHFDSSMPPVQQPYYDNDNIAIKGILDSVVPYICVDDAIKYCDNLYVAQPDYRDYVEVNVVKEDMYPYWLRSRTDLNFAKNCLNLI